MTRSMAHPQTEDRPKISGNGARVPLPDEFVERGRCPFDPPAVVQELAAEAPLSEVALLDGTSVWMVTRFEDARAVLADPRFSADRIAASLPADYPEDARAELLHRRNRDGFFITMDPPEHTRLRSLLTGQFTVRRMRALQPRIHQIVTEHIDAMLAAGTSADLVSAFALPIPSLVICELLGVPYARREEFQTRTADLLRLDTTPEESIATRNGIRAFLREIVDAKRAEPGDDMISGLITSGADPALTDDELINMGFLLLVAGHETTANMIGLGTFALLRNPEQLASLRADPTLIAGAVEELLRYLSIIHLGILRVATDEVTVAGTTLPAGSRVLVSVAEANRDPAHWDDPTALELHRERAPHLAFGFGVHQCLGQQLARNEMTVAFTELLRRLPDLRLAVAPEDVPVRSDMGIYGVHALPVAWG